ncbi:hypothetical protein AB6D34_18265 [Pectobacterium brasiliense]|uniref:Uncharacterized protein n=1 Tax=Pectobacterium brasiliense TaxID=180957 RepID=A0A433NBQ3_9GAMM|nr:MULTISPECIES: hypothetical protein [Pectobacterium]GKW29480.1 hypothetical protein PEC331060_26580 [Pectobacterium carotovorum subsp. carotovorum]MBN3048110.1 hypothetical protein [Pectobacterium brasiliense]MBN3057085.1 hypothetical protein [Pectobacterium brasiliense]MBN3077603.1 hypothetical protein [Pectobacterium brasiliense]MBN3082042.1 hypothetical protein [Pectobacterium polaris]
MLKTPLIISAILLACQFPANATANWHVGDFVRQTQRWDEDSKSFLHGAAEGEGEGCWQITAVTPERITLKLISGHFKPWWSDKPIATGESDEWFDSGIYKEANPSMPPLSEIKATFSTVASCKP